MVRELELHTHTEQVDARDALAFSDELFVAAERVLARHTAEPKHAQEPVNDKVVDHIIDIALNKNASPKNSE